VATSDCVGSYLPTTQREPFVNERRFQGDGPQLDRRLPERDQLRCMSVNDGHHIRMRFVDIAVNVNLQEFVLARPLHRSAVEIVFDDGLDGCAPRRNGARDEVVVGLPRSRS